MANSVTNMEGMKGMTYPGSISSSADTLGDVLSDLTCSEVDEDMTWIEWFCSLKGNEVFVFVEEEFVRDDFNLTGLSSMVPHYDKALSLILNGDVSDASVSDGVSYSYIEKSAALLFGLIHARYILTPKGIHALYQKVVCHFYAKKCVNALCNCKSIVPCSVTNVPTIHTTKLFCPRCNELYHPPSSSYLNVIDGAFFGTAVAGLFFMTFPQLLPPPIKSGPFRLTTSSEQGQNDDADASSKQKSLGTRPPYYIPTIFGYKVHPDSRMLQRDRQIHHDSSQSQRCIAPANMDKENANCTRAVTDTKMCRPGNTAASIAAAPTKGI